MTDDERNEFEKSIDTARRVYREHQHGDPTPLGVVVGALIRAVELLAGQDQFRDAAKVEPTSAGHFDDALVERLAKSGSPDWEFLPDYMQERRRRHTRAILTELASMPCELPTNDQIQTAHSVGSATNTSILGAEAVLRMLRARMAPILAAKDAKIAELQARFEQDQKALHEAHERIAELESRTPANECSNAERTQYEKTIELQKQRIAELETRLKSSEMVRDAQRRNVQKLWDFLRECDDQLFTTWNPTWDLLSRVKARVAELEKRIAGLEIDVAREKSFGDVHHKKCEDQRAEIVELEKRIAELTAPMVVDGKTPGQVNQAAFAYSVENHHESKGVPNWEIAANAVLRAFGNGAKQLREVRERIDANYEGQTTESILETIDFHIEKIEGAKVQIGRVCATCSRPEGMHYDPIAKADTCRMFKKRSDQREA